MKTIFTALFSLLIHFSMAQFQTTWIRLEKDSTITGYNRIEDMFIDQNANVYVNGSIDTFQTFAPVIISYDSSGLERWRRTVNGSEYTFSFNWRMLARPNGNILCAGHYEDQSGTNNMIYVEFNQSGDSVGGAVMNAPGFATGDDLGDACLDSDGNIYLAGQIRSGNDFPAAVSRFDSSAHFHWLSSYPLLPGWNASMVRAVEMHNDTGMYCLTFNFTGYGSLLYCDTAGNFLWQTTLPISLNEYHTALATDKAGNAIAGGHLNQGYGIVKVSPAGDTLWSREFSYPGLSAAGGEVINIQCDDDGNIYTLGIFSGQPYYSLVSKFDSTGFMLWSDTVRGFNHVYGMNKEFFQLQDGVLTLVTIAGGSRLYRFNTSGQRLTDQALVLPGADMPEVNSIAYHNGSLYLAGNSYAGFNLRNGFTARLDDLSAGIHSSAVELDQHVYPNPVKNILHLVSDRFTAEGCTYIILNIEGKEMQQGVLSGSSAKIEIPGFSNGVYVILINNGGKLSRSKFVVMN